MQTTRCSFRCFCAMLLLLALAGTLFPQLVRAKHVRADVINVPVARLITNLEAIARNRPRDVQVRFNLARVHAMAYALKTDTAEVLKGRENEGVWFGYEPANAPFTVKPSDDKIRLKEAGEHLRKAIERYQEVLKMDPGNLPAGLGYAWCLEQSGAKQRAVNEYRKVIDAAWEKDKDLKEAPLGWVSVTVEAAGYLIPLLDKRKDSREIDALQKRIARLDRVLRPITPLVIPLRDGLGSRQLEDRSANVAFDADGTGLRKGWTWITKDAGWLVYDQVGTQKITSALQMFGSVTFWLFWENGYHALAALDDDRDGFLAGSELEGLAIWQDLNRNGVADQGEVKPLADWGVVALSTQYIRDKTHPDQIAYSPRGVFFRDGSSRPTYDLILRSATTIE